MAHAQKTKTIKYLGERILKKSYSLGMGKVRNESYEDLRHRLVAWVREGMEYIIPFLSQMVVWLITWKGMRNSLRNVIPSKGAFFTHRTPLFFFSFLRSRNENYPFYPWSICLEFIKITTRSFESKSWSILVSLITIVKGNIKINIFKVFIVEAFSKNLKRISIKS